jgi:peptidyl-prolyl cis-trans isomerase SurA
MKIHTHYTANTSDSLLQPVSMQPNAPFLASLMNSLYTLGFACLLITALFCRPVTVSAKTFSVDGMIGQVNGRAIYTNAVLDEQLRETLARWGQELPRDVFRKRAAERIAIRLNSMVTDALVYGEAKRDLSDQERQGLTMAQSRQREKLLREHGQGSPALAEANLIENTGLTLDQTLENWLQAAVVSRYMGQKLRPKVNVTRKDVKRYYNDHYDEFNPSGQRTVRVIQTVSDEDTQQIQPQLDAGTSFEIVAQSDLNQFRPDTGGLMGAMAGDQLFADPQVNQATLDLEAGQFAGPITVGDKNWFVYVEKIEQPNSQPLMEVQVRIHATLYQQQLREHSERYREKLFTDGSYNSIEQMTLSLLEIVTDRYTNTNR